MGISSESKEFAPSGANSFFKSRSHFRRAAYQEARKKVVSACNTGRKHGSVSVHLNPFVYWWTFPLLSVGRVYLLFVAVSGLFCRLWKILLANNVDPDQMPHYVASDLGPHCLPMTLLRVSR